MKQNKTYLSLGSNLGKRKKNLLLGIDELKKIGDNIKVSSFYCTSPLENNNQPDYINCSVLLQTFLLPHELLFKIKEIERNISGEKPYRYGPRILDIDILLYDDLTLNEDNLTIPHQKLRERLFYILPLLELNKDLCIPNGTPISSILLKNMKNKIYSCQKVKKC